MTPRDWLMEYAAECVEVYGAPLDDVARALTFLTGRPAVARAACDRYREGGAK